MAGLLKEKGFVAGYALMLFGLALLVAGLGLDAVLHSRDADRGNEEIFTLGNPGHLLVMAGLGAAVLGAFVGTYSRWVLGRTPKAVSAAVPLFAAAAVAAAVSSGLALDLESSSHGEDSPAAAAAHITDGSDPVDASASHGGDHLANILPRHRATVALEESTFHEFAEPGPVTEENLRFAEQFLLDVRRETARFQNVAVALSEGYFQITPDLPLIGAHFFNPGHSGSGLDAARPGIVLYEDDGAGGWRLVGLAYMLPKAPGDDTPPQTPLGSLVAWHYHTNLCFTLGAGVTIADGQAQCPGLFVAETPWLLHVWAWKDSPEGVFNHANSLLQ